MVTSAERIDIAGTMMALTCHGVENMGLGEVLNSILSDGAPQPTSDGELLGRLACLIDPTATAIVCGNADPSRGRVDAFAVCSECDSVIGPLTGTGPVLLARYCPHCGARIAMLHYD